MLICVSALTIALLLLALIYKPPSNLNQQNITATSGLYKKEPTMSYLPAIEIEPNNTADASIIWLHGLGADGNDFVPVVPELRLPKDLNIRFIFPHAPSIPITINGGMVMPGWYDIKAINIDREVDTEQLFASAKKVHDLIDREIERGVDSKRIILIGFSQGGAVNYHAALTYPKPLAGLGALSTYFATANQTTIEDANKNIPIFIGHGTHDPMVHESLGLQAKALLESKGFQPIYKNYPMEHSVSLEEIQDISHWIQSIL